MSKAETNNVCDLSVLVVDDDATTRMLAERALVSAGFVVLQAGDGREALDMVAESPEQIGAIVLDVLLPAVGGFQVLETLKRQEQYRDIPVMLLTAKANAEADVIRGIEVGADDHVQKPFRDKVLAAKVRALCERRLESLELARRLRVAEELATTDALTTLGNRRAFEAQVAVEVAFSKRHRQPLSLLVFDVDHFKDVNDRFGHPEGDRALYHVSEVIRSSLRVSDQAYRLGGEEFAVLLRECGATGAQITANRVLRGVGGQDFTFHNGDVQRITLSGGIAVMDEHNDFDAERLLERADDALYQAKKAGRGRVVMERGEQITSDERVSTAAPRA